MATLHPSLIALMFLNRFSSCANKKNQTKATSIVSDLHWIEVEFLIFATKKKKGRREELVCFPAIGQTSGAPWLSPNKRRAQASHEFQNVTAQSLE